ncbi:hypothetical protein LC049_22420, partial [Nitratireductor aquimarinus]|uniref:hypothetical protein n=1 Tax=Nitratireductor aquimarinus TaxID=889300 RepID=UPI001A8D90FD
GAELIRLHHLYRSAPGDDMHHPATATEYKERLFIHALYIVEIKTKTTLSAPLCRYAAWIEDTGR